MSVHHFFFFFALASIHPSVVVQMQKYPNFRRVSNHSTLSSVLRSQSFGQEKSTLVGTTYVLLPHRHLTVKKKVLKFPSSSYASQKLMQKVFRTHWVSVLIFQSLGVVTALFIHSLQSKEGKKDLCTAIHFITDNQSKDFFRFGRLFGPRNWSHFPVVSRPTQEKVFFRLGSVPSWRLWNVSFRFKPLSATALFVYTRLIELL